MNIYLKIILLLFAAPTVKAQGLSYSGDVIKKIGALHDKALAELDHDPAAALRFIKSAQQLSRSVNNDTLLVQSLIDLSTWFRHTGNIDSAVYTGQHGLEAAKISNNTALEARANSNLADCYFKRGMTDKAISFQLKSLKIREQCGDLPGMVNSLFSLGALFSSLGDSLQAKAFFNSCFNTAQKSGDPKLMALASEGLASYYYNTAGYRQAIQFYRNSLQLYTKCNDAPGIATSLCNLGSLYDETGLPHESIACYKKALRLFEALGSKENILLCYSNLGATYVGMGQPDQALAYAHKAMLLAEQLHTLGHLKNIYSNISDIYHGKNNIDSAFKYYEKAMVIKDTLLDLEKIKHINQLQAGYNKEKREQEIAALKEQQKLRDAEMAMHKKRNFLLFTTSCLFAAVALLVFLIYRQRTRSAGALAEKNEQLYRKQITEVIKEQELRSINSMMEGQENERRRIAEALHDRLGSMLATIKLHFNAIDHKVDKLEQKSKEQYSRANKLLDEVCDEVRRIAHNMESGVLVNFGLVHALTDLKDALQHSSALTISVNSFGMHKRLDTNTEISVYRAIQELLSNVVKHAKATEVHIDINRSEEQLTIILSDNGIGYNPDAESNRPGMGLKNILSRVTKLGGKFYVDSGKQNGTTNIIEIPVKDDQTTAS